MRPDDFFLNPWTPVVFGVAYFAITKTLSHYQDGKNRMQGKRWKAFVVIHNMILAVYSGWTFASTAPAFFGAFWRAFNEGGTAGLLHVLCDSDTAAWAATQFVSARPYFAYTFYISKFYEVIDTAIILAKGKRVGMLQSYHHTGAIWTMFAGFRTGAFPIWIFVVFNSFIHTLMYIFYTCSALKIPFPTFLKKSLTKLQITQFLIGGSLAASYLFIQLPTFAQHKDAVLDKLSFGQLSLESVARMGTQCVVDQGQRAAVWLNVAYLIPLTYLFGAFFVKSYQAKSKAAQKKAKIASEAKAGGIKAE
ncbi:hypothetical protein RQP46_001116 [Phenoliferia psychrophenolica]